MDEAVQIFATVTLRQVTILSPTLGLVLDGELMAAAMLAPLSSFEITTSLKRWIKLNNTPIEEKTNV